MKGFPYNNTHRRKKKKKKKTAKFGMKRMESSPSSFSFLPLFFIPFSSTFFGIEGKKKEREREREREEKRKRRRRLRRVLHSMVVQPVRVGEGTTTRAHRARRNIAAEAAETTRERDEREKGRINKHREPCFPCHILQPSQ